MRKWFLVATLLVPVLGLGSWASYQAGRRGAEAQALSAARLASPSSSSSAPLVDLRGLIAQAVARAPVRDEADLDPYLDGLERAAREKGQVTALEVEAGLRVIQRHTADSERVEQFSERMLQLDRELGGQRRHEPRPAAAVRAELTSLLGSLQHPRDGVEREALIANYLRIAAELPDTDREELVSELDALVAPKAPGAIEGVDALWGAIEAETDSSNQQALIAAYLDATRELPEDERDSRLSLLDQRYGMVAAPDE